MKTTRTVSSPVNGKEIPVTVDLKVKQLTISGIPVKNGNGRQIMDDEWIYIWCKGYGNISINVNRASYCQKVYLSNVSILDSIGYDKITKELQNFIDTVSDKLVFEFNLKTYQVFLKKTKSGYDIDFVKPYWATILTGGIMSSWSFHERLWPGCSQWNYKGVNIDETFHVSI